MVTLQKEQSIEDKNTDVASVIRRDVKAVSPNYSLLPPDSELLTAKTTLPNPLLTFLKYPSIQQQIWKSYLKSSSNLKKKSYKAWVHSRPQNSLR